MGQGCVVWVGRVVCRGGLVCVCMQYAWCVSVCVWCMSVCVHASMHAVCVWYVCVECVYGACQCGVCVWYVCVWSVCGSAGFNCNCVICN